MIKHYRIELDETDHLELKTIAVRQKTTMAAIIRTFVSEFIRGMDGERSSIDIEKFLKLVHAPEPESEPEPVPKRKSSSSRARKKSE